MAHIGAPVRKRDFLAWDLGVSGWQVLGSIIWSVKVLAFRDLWA